MLIEAPHHLGVVLDTKDAVHLIKGPCSETMLEAAQALEAGNSWIGEFESVNRKFKLMFRGVQDHPKMRGARVISAEIPSGRDVVALWAPADSIPGYLWLNVNPKQLTFRRENTFRPVLGM